MTIDMEVHQALMPILGLSDNQKIDLVNQLMFSYFRLTPNQVLSGYQVLPDPERFKILARCMLMNASIGETQLISMIQPYTHDAVAWGDLQELFVHLVETHYGYSKESLIKYFDDLARNPNLPDEMVDRLVELGCWSIWSMSWNHTSQWWTDERIENLIDFGPTNHVTCPWVVEHRDQLSKDQFDTFFARALEAKREPLGASSMRFEFPWAAEDEAAGLEPGEISARSDDKNDIFHQVADGRIETTEKSLRRLYSLGARMFGHTLAGNPSLPEEVMDFIYAECVNGTPEFARMNHSEGKLRKLLANPACPSRYLYANLENRVMWQAMACNPNLPDDVAKFLAGDGDEGALEGLLHNPSLTPERWDAIAGQLAKGSAEMFLINLANRETRLGSEHLSLLANLNWSEGSLMAAFHGVAGLERTGHRSVVDRSQKWLVYFVWAACRLNFPHLVNEMVQATAPDRWYCKAWANVLKNLVGLPAEALYAIEENATENDSELAVQLIVHETADIKLMKAIAERWGRQDSYVTGHAVARLNAIYKKQTEAKAAEEGTSR